MGRGDTDLCVPGGAQHRQALRRRGLVRRADAAHSGVVVRCQHREQVSVAAGVAGRGATHLVVFVRDQFLHQIRRACRVGGCSCPYQRVCVRDQFLHQARRACRVGGGLATDFGVGMRPGGGDHRRRAARLACRCCQHYWVGGSASPQARRSGVPRLRGEAALMPGRSARREASRVHLLGWRGPSRRRRAHGMGQQPGGCRDLRAHAQR